MKRPDKLSKTFCTAPWVHAYYDSTGQRFPCSIMYLPPPDEDPLNYDAQRSLEEWRNCDTQVQMRKDMLDGKVIRECGHCNVGFGEQRRVEKVYKDYWNSTYTSSIDEIFDKTNPDGTTTFEPISFDYRTNIKCNFKCRMCTPFQSSAIYDEVINNNITDHIGYYNRNDIEEIDWVSKKQYEDEILDKEFLEAAQSGRLVDINFAGGEPLLLPIHWDVLDTLIENDSARNVEIRYQSNLSLISYRDKHLKDLVPKFRSCAFQASIDAGGAAGEYLRTGLNWNKWKRNYIELNNAWKDIRKINFWPQASITIFSIFGLDELCQFMGEQDISLVDIQLVSSAEKTTMLSPYILPENVKQDWLDYYFSVIKKYNNTLTSDVYNHLYQFGEKITPMDDSIVPGMGSWKNFTDEERERNKINSYKYLKNLDDIRGSDMNIFLQNIPSLQKWFNEIRDAG